MRVKCDHIYKINLGKMLNSKFNNNYLLGKNCFLQNKI